MASHCLLLRSRCQHFTKPGKATRLRARYVEISQHPDSTVSSSQGAWLATRYYCFPCSRQPASFWNLVGQRALSLAFLVFLRLLFPVSLSVLPFLQILVTLRILAVLRFSREFRQFCLALHLSTERSFEHCPPLAPAGRTSIQFPQPDDCESPSDKQDCTTSIQFPRSDESERHSDFPARSRSNRKCPVESDGRVWEQYDTLDATGELASICGIGLSSFSSRSPQSRQSPPVRGRPGGFDGNGRRSSPAAFTVSGVSSAQDR